MHKTVEPLGASAQTRNAPAKVAPEVMPTKMPSFCANSRLQRRASAPGIRRIRSMTPVSTITGELRDKIGAPPLHRMRLPSSVGCRGGPVTFALLRTSARQHRRIIRLADDDLGVRPFLGA